MSKKRLDPSVIRPDDVVRIVNPVIVNRVGYPKQVSDFYDEAIQKLSDAKLIHPARHTFASSSLDRPRYETVNDRFFNFNKIDRNVIDALAYSLWKENRCGGPERTLHTQEFPEFKGQTFRVTEKKVVKTGEYFAPSSYRSGYFGSYEYDYEPGGLANEKTHVLLYGTVGERVSDSEFWKFKNIKIEKTNVEKVK